MNNKANKKLLVLSFLFIIFGATITLANSSNNFLNVKPVLNRAIQTIQKIAFNVDAIRHPEALDKEVIVESNQGTVLIRWRVRALVDWTTGTLTPDSSGSSLFYWKNNYLAGTDSFIIAWESNTITHNVSNSAIIWWTNNTLNSWDNIYILWGSGNDISWINSYIVWWESNVINWTNSYIIWGSNSTISWANSSVAAWSDIIIDKDNVFAWKDTSDNVKLKPKKDNTFILFAQNWMSIWYTTPNNVLAWTVDINWIFQVSTELKRCGVNIAGAVQYLPIKSWDVIWGEVYDWGLYWCFCSCDGKEWVSMIPSGKCRALCPTITWAVDEDFQKGVCRYDRSQQATVWAMDASQACDNWEAADFNITPDANWYPLEWSWKCVGNETTDDHCYAKAKREVWECSVNPSKPGYADYYNKCKWWYLSWLKFDDKTGLYTWSCASINQRNTNNSCKACKDNWTYKKGPDGSDICVNENWRCNNDINWKTFGELNVNSTGNNWKWLCEYRRTDGGDNDYEFQPITWEDWKRQIAWTWKCKWEASTVQCSANYRIDPGRCEPTTVSGIHVYGKCKNWNFTGVKEKDPETNIISWTCEWVNDDRDVQCRWCPPWYKYDREKSSCKKICCEYNTWIVHNLDWTITASSCHTSITLMDHDLWATGLIKTGLYYQWWNNYWFTKTEAKNRQTTSRAVWSDDYNRAWYYSDQFRVQARNESTCNKYNYWTRDCTNHRDIWWWRIDGYVAWNYGYQFWSDTILNVHSKDIQYFIDDMYSDPKKRWIKWEDYTLNDWALARQWPCPEWYHVPAAWEWWALLTIYCTRYPKNCVDDTDQKKERTSLSKWILTRSVSNETLWDNFSKEFKLNKAWRIMSDETYAWTMLSEWIEWFYRSSSADWDNYIHILWFNKAQIYATRGNWESRRWIPIRCFKNPEIIDDEDPKNACPDN